MPGNALVTTIRRSCAGKGSGRQSAAYAVAHTAVPIAMPTVRIANARAGRSGCARVCRHAWCRSEAIECGNMSLIM